MRPTLCSRCKKNVAVIFITKIENGVSTNEGLCLKCAKELGIKQVDDMVKQMGISDEDLENMSGEMMSLLGGNPDPDAPEDDDMDGRTATFPFLSKLFGGLTGREPERPQPQELAQSPQAPQAPNQPPKKKHKFLDSYCLDLTRRAREGKLDRIIGREEETERVIQILNRRQKNNPCLIGEPGVGKTAIAEGLAQKIVAGEVPWKLRDKEVFLLDMTAMVAGTQFRGQFESRMKNLIQEIKACGNIILVIDEVHNLVGAGDAEGSMNAANILKPALSRGEVQVLGATTFKEYRKYIEKDSALERRFQPVTVTEPTIDQSVEILKGIAPYYEQYHGVEITPEIARQTVLLSERYITDRFLPDKAIDLLDEACSDENLRNPNINKLADASKELADVEFELKMLTEKTEEKTPEDYERIAKLRTRSLQLGEIVADLESRPKPRITMENLARIIELWTKIPASKIQAQEYEHLRNLDDNLKQHVVGQDEAIASICSAIRRSRAGISPKKRPVSFIFVGATGVGKTELVRRLAADMFDTPEALIRLDMSEYMEKFAVSRLIGAPPGYVGYDEAGQLTEKVRRRPYSVILFDEIEKAHPDVLNILLQILDDGRVTDAHGRTVNFANTIIIMTSNAGSGTSDGAVGFGQTVAQQGKEKALKALSDIMRPEFINRIDEIVAFNTLTEENFHAIAEIQLGDLKKTLEDRGVTLSWDDAFLDYATKKSYSVKFGARNLQRLLQKEVEDVLAARMIENYAHPVKAVHLSAKDGAADISIL